MSKQIKSAVIILILVTGLAASFAAGCILAPADRGLDTVNEAWGIIFQNYVDQTKLDSANLSTGAIKGMVEALNDPYTAYLDPHAYLLSTSDMQGKFGGIGATVELRDKKITVVTPLPDSPAVKAGIKSGDTILGIDGRSTSGMSVAEAVSRIRGPKGTAVKLLIQHLNETRPVAIEIIRAEIKLPSVFFEMKGDTAYIRITHFTEQTDEELSSVLGNITRNGATGIILDLRSNLGGLLREVADVASHFIKEGIIVSIVDNQGKKESLSVKASNTTTDLPMVVLTDNYSASGSEVLAGALQEHKRATIAGMKTYGKGSVNQLYPLRDGSGLYITVARWLTPEGRTIEGKGITPDPGYMLDLEGDAAIQWALNFLKSKRQ